jgi:EAL domain-containing protein (putative c-di-GMP-specific phosphodiesterase class I)
MMSPEKFIPLAEQTGLIVPIGEWVIRNVCRQNKKWQDEGLPIVRVAINLSIVQFQSPEIVNRISRILLETGLSSEYLELEITESVAIGDQEHVISVLNKFHELGLYISVDDFGTEYSSLQYLKSLPVDRIKIPMPFIQGINKHEKDEAIVQTIIALANNMGMHVIAEGVDTEDQESFLTQRMCDVMQGFHYYKPMTAQEVEVLLREINT